MIKTRPESNLSNLSKKNSATSNLKTVLTLTIISMVTSGFMLVTIIKKPMPSTLHKQLLLVADNPYLVARHTQLAQVYLDLENIEKAQEEIDISFELFQNNLTSNSQVLGMTNEINFLQQQIIERLQTQKQLLSYWSKITQSYPDYRDGWVSLLFAAYNSSNKTVFKQALTNISKFDPEYVNKLPGVVSKF